MYRGKLETNLNMEYTFQEELQWNKLYVIWQIAKAKYLRLEIIESELILKLAYHFQNIRVTIMTEDRKNWRLLILLTAEGPYWQNWAHGLKVMGKDRKW